MAERTEYAEGEFCWIDLMAHDMAAAEAFYGKVFGWEPDPQDTQGGPPYTVFRLRGKEVAGMGQMMDEMKSQGVPPIWNSYINVDDVETATNKAAALGAQVQLPPMQVVEAGWMSMIQDPTGAMVALWKKNRHFGAELCNEPGSFSWNELATRDIEGARKFYGDLLGWQFEENKDSPSKYYIIKNDGRDNGGIIEMTEQWGEMPPHWAVYFTVANAADAVQQIESQGGSTLVPPFEIPIGKIGVVSDPHGGVFSVFEFAQTPQ